MGRENKMAKKSTVLYHCHFCGEDFPPEKGYNKEENKIYCPDCNSDDVFFETVEVEEVENSLHEASTALVIDVLLSDLQTFIEKGTREINFNTEKFFDTGLSEHMEEWLNKFYSYPSGFDEDEINFIKSEVSEYLGIMAIWVEDIELQKGIVALFQEYFGQKKGFCNLVIEIYLSDLKKYLAKQMEEK
jgi:DNA-directed RNA polymerase subunit RPC12/RpoP